jgi:hypothetical protein
MVLYKVSKTARAKHIGTYHNDKSIALSAKQIAGYEYHLYKKVSTTFGSKWEKVV